MPGTANTSKDTKDADVGHRRRKVVKRAMSALQASLTQEHDISDGTLDRAIAILKEARELTSRPISRPSSPPQGSWRAGHKRHGSDQYDQLTVWMRLRHTSKPSRGYRVQYEGAWTTVTIIGGLQASSIFPNPSRGFTDAKLKQLTNDHLDWNSRQGSPFISIFTDEQHAEDWAMKWSERNGGKTASVLHIECNKITRLFSVKEVVNSLGIDTDMLPEQYEDEYLAVNQIPTEAIVENRPIFSKTALMAAMATDTDQPELTRLTIPPQDPDHVQRFSPVRINERRSLLLENGINFGDYLNRGFSEANDVPRDVSPT